MQRRARLEALLKRAKCAVIRFSETFPNANDLLAECVRLGLEGIVAKRKDAPYRSGTRRKKPEGYRPIRGGALRPPPGLQLGELPREGSRARKAHNPITNAKQP